MHLQTDKTEVPQQFALFLTPVEFDVWSGICRNSGKDRCFVAPLDPRNLVMEWCRREVPFDPDEYASVFAKFLQAGLIKAGESDKDSCLYECALPSDAYLPVEIDARPDREIERLYVHLAGQALREVQPPYSRASVRAWLRMVISRDKLDLHPTTTAERIVGPTCLPDGKIRGFGFFHYPESDEAGLPSVEGFRPFGFTVVDREPRRFMGRKSSAKPEAEPEIPMLAMPHLVFRYPSSLRDLDDALLQRLLGEYFDLRKAAHERIELIQQEMSVRRAAQCNALRGAKKS